MSPFRRKSDNEWTRADRHERRKNVVAVLVIVALAVSAVVLLIWALTAH